METKICTKCKKELPIEDFNWRNKAAGTRRSECKYCHSGYMKAKYKEKQQIVEQLKTQLACAKCGEARGYVLDYHHINPEDKENSVARMLTNHNKIDKVYEEIKKCVVLCANCHREFHYFNSLNKNFTLDEYLNTGSQPNGQGTRL